MCEGRGLPFYPPASGLSDSCYTPGGTRCCCSCRGARRRGATEGRTRRCCPGSWWLSELPGGGKKEGERERRGGCLRLPLLRAQQRLRPPPPSVASPLPPASAARRLQPLASSRFSIPLAHTPRPPPIAALRPRPPGGPAANSRRRRRPANRRSVPPSPSPGSLRLRGGTEREKWAERKRRGGVKKQLFFPPSAVSSEGRGRRKEVGLPATNGEPSGQKASHPRGSYAHFSSSLLTAAAALEDRELYGGSERKNRHMQKHQVDMLPKSRKYIICRKSTVEH